MLVLAAVALLGACGSDDSSSDATTTSTTSTTPADETTTTQPELFGGDVCTALDPADLSEVTNEEFDEGTSGEDSCTYTSTTGSAISINVADVSDSSVEDTLAAGSSECDDGTVETVTFEGADGAFTCAVDDVATVAAIGSGVIVVLTGETTDPAVDTAGVTAALVQILENAIAGG